MGKNTILISRIQIWHTIFIIKSTGIQQAWGKAIWTDVVPNIATCGYNLRVIVGYASPALSLVLG